MNIGEKIIKLRKSRNISQEKLSEMIGVTRQTLSNWESDITSPDLKQTKKISEIFNVSLDELTGNKQKLFKTKLSIKQIVYILGLILILTVSIILLTKRDYTRKYQTEIYCRINDENITLSIVEDENKKYVIHHSGKDSGDLNAGNTLDEAFKVLETTKETLISQGAFCK
jgi:transcriptional regulator with XRE-family HTH domain